MANIAILGAGGFGISLAVMLDRFNNNIILYSAVQSEIEQLRQTRENKRLLPNVTINETINLTTKIEDISSCEVIIFAVASKFLKLVCMSAKDYISKAAFVVNVGKGFCENKRLSEILNECIPNDVVVLSGPSHAEEIAMGVPTTIVASSKSRNAAEYVQDLMVNTNLRVYVSDDIIGVEIGGALKNIIALCAGICDGLKLGDNTKAALMTRGLAEIARLGIAMGAQRETFAGLTGMGDLIVTCTSMHSRNRRCGILIGEGMNSDEAISQIGMTVEGCEATKSAYTLGKQYSVDLPITTEIYNVLYNAKDLRQALLDLMQRPKRHESEEIWLLEK